MALVKEGRREFISILKLLGSVPYEDLVEVVKEASRTNITQFAAIKQMALRRADEKVVKLDVNRRPQVPNTTVESNKVSAYNQLLKGENDVSEHRHSDQELSQVA